MGKGTACSGRSDCSGWLAVCDCDCDCDCNRVRWLHASKHLHEHSGSTAFTHHHRPTHATVQPCNAARTTSGTTNIALNKQAWSSSAAPNDLWGKPPLGTWTADQAVDGGTSASQYGFSTAGGYYNAWW